MRKLLLFIVPLAALVLVAAYVRDRYSNRDPGPIFALLVFGTDQPREVLVRLTGDALAFDVDDDGAFTPADVYFDQRADCREFVVDGKDGATRYVITGVSGYRDQVSESLMVHVRIEGPAAYRQYCDLAMRPLGQQPDVAHFDGPLIVEPRKTGWQLPAGLVLKKGDEPTDLNVVVGTMNPARGTWVVTYSLDTLGGYAFPADVAPMVDVEFPPKEAGGAPIHRRYALHWFC